MMTTEEEAKTKRCQESFGDTVVSPQGHSFAAAQPGVNFMSGAGFAVASSPSMCIGSACMAWRWSQLTWWSDPVTGQDIKNDPNRPFGYCGKAGRP